MCEDAIYRAEYSINVKGCIKMKYYVAVKMLYVGELYTVSGPFDSFEEAEADLDVQITCWNDMLDEDEYLGIVSHDEDIYAEGTKAANNGSWNETPNFEKKQAHEYEKYKKEISRERSRVERKDYYKKHWKTILILLFIIFCPLIAYCKYTEYQKTVKVGVSSTNLIGREYSAVEKMLSESGFTNLHQNIIQDLAIDDSQKEGIVTDVSIRGENQFVESSRFPYDAKIEITYHLVKNINAPMSSKNAKKLNYTDLEKSFRDAGFKNVTIEAEYDLITGWIAKEGSIESVSIGEDTSFSEADSYRPDVKVLIKYHAFSKNNAN